MPIPTKATPQQFSRAIESTNQTPWQTSVFERKILLQHQAQLERAKAQRAKALDDRCMERSKKVIAQIEEDFELRLQDLEKEENAREAVRKRREEHQKLIDQERKYKLHERAATAAAKLAAEAEEKRKIAEDRQQKYNEQMARAAERTANMHLSRVNAKFEKYVSERRTVKNQSAAFWFKELQKWKEQTIVRPSTSPAPKDVLTPRSGLQQAMEDEASGLPLRSRYRLTAETEKLKRRPRSAIPSQPVPLAFGATPQEEKKPAVPFTSLSFEDRQRIQQDKELVREKGVQEQKRIDAEKRKIARSIAREHQEEVFNASLSLTSEHQANKEKILDSFFERSQSFQSTSPQRQRQVEERGREATEHRQNCYNRHHHLRDAVLQSRAEERTKAMQRFAARIAKKTMEH